MNTSPRLKDQLFHRQAIEALGKRFAAVDPAFDVSGFVQTTLDGFEPLELKQRIHKIAVGLEAHLPDDYRAACQWMVAALPPPLDPARSDDDFGDFIYAPLGEYVVRRFPGKRHLPLALRTLKQVTMRFSMEYAIRFFINAYPQETFRKLEAWASDSHYHVRRLVSEGTRPRLPWATRLSIPHTQPLPLLDRLHADPTRYVTRSVANHLNDIAKTDPGLVLQTLQRWQAAAQQQPQELQWMARHALRTLIKQGHPAALELLGYSAQPAIAVRKFQLACARVSPGQALEFSFEITARQATRLLIDYAIDFVKADGRRSAKVFKLKQLSLAAGQRVVVHKRHPLRANATTFRLYPGQHHLTLQINGRPAGSLPFHLCASV